MSDWFESAFSKDYLVLYPHRNDAEARRDVDRILALLDPPRDQPLLDLCCGAGRHLEALYDAGFATLTGLDLSQDLLHEAQARFQRAGASDIQLHRADMREIPFEDRFATVLSMFTSFGYFEDPLDDVKVLRGAFRALRANGTLLMDTLNRETVILNLTPREVRESDDVRLHIARSLSPDEQRIEKETRVVASGRQDLVYHESVRMYTMEEMQAMLCAVGFEDVRAYGSLDGCAYEPLSPRMVLVARKRGPHGT